MIQSFLALSNMRSMQMQMKIERMGKMRTIKAMKLSTPFAPMMMRGRVTSSNKMIGSKCKGSGGHPVS